jgi:hypothetical protein
LGLLCLMGNVLIILWDLNLVPFPRSGSTIRLSLGLGVRFIVRVWRWRRGNCCMGSRRDLLFFLSLLFQKRIGRLACGCESVETERASRAERIREWEAYCRPILRYDRYGVGRYVYRVAGCEFGRSQD